MFETTDPKQPFYVLNQIDLFPQDEKILIKLYQPLVGAIALSLYQTLIQDFDEFEMKSEAKGIYSLQEQLDCSLRDLFTSLHRLEAVGLVQTYLVDNQVNKLLAFKLLKVPNSQEFFATSLLASLLKEKVGENAFNSLSKSFAREAKSKIKPLENAQNVSASFLEVFRLPMDEAISPSSDVLQAAKDNQVAQNFVATVNNQDSIDWEFIKDQFSRYHISELSVENNKLAIRDIMSTYGLSEQEFIDETLPTLHGRNELNIRAIEKLLSENYRSDQTREKINQTLQNSSANEQQRLSSAKQNLIKQATELSPAEFLYKIKEQKGGFASPSEKRILNVLRSQYGLPSDMINMLVYACLSYDSMVTANLAYRIANDWLQHGISNAVQALTYLENRKNNRTSRPTYQKQTKRIEKGTDWTKKKANTETNVNSEDLKNFFKNLEDKNEPK